MKEKINEIFTILISILFMASSILIKSTNPYYKYVQILGYSIIIIYCIIRLIQKKPVKIIQNNLDICVILLVISTVIPVIFNTYVSLSGSIQTILQYTYAICIYVLLREVTRSGKGTSKIISNVFIIFTVILILIGIDGITSNLLFNFLNRIGVGEYLNGEDRLISIFGYPNVFAAYMASILFLNINEYLNQYKKIVKSIYKTITLILMIGIILTYSKGIFLILPILLLFYILIIKGRRQRIEEIVNILISFIMAVVYVIAFEKLSNLENYILIWIELAIVVFINYFINIILEKTSTYIEKIPLKKIILFFMICMISSIIFIAVALNIEDEYIVFTEAVESDYEAKVINHIKGNEQYLFEFNIEAKAPKDIEDTYTINIIERDFKNQEIGNTEITFGTYEGTKQIEIRTKEETSEVKVEFCSKYKYAEKVLIVKNFYINNKEVPLQYKYLPTKLIEKIKNISINYKTSQERIEIVKNAIELSKENSLTAIGGNGWRYRYKEVQSYNYIAKSIHSYPAKIILEFGVLGIIAYVGIAVILIKKLIQLIKNPNIEILSILFALVTLALHSIIDTDMEYTHIVIYVFGLLGIISRNIEGKKEKNNKISIVANISFILIMIISSYFTFNTNIYNKYSNITNLLSQRNGLKVSSEEYAEINFKIAQEYENITNFERYSYLETYCNVISYYINSNYENTEEILENYYEKISQYKNENKNDIDSIMNKLQSVYALVENLEKQNNSRYYEITEKFIDIILEEYEQTVEDVKQCSEKQYIDENIYILKIEDIYKKAKEIKNKYLLGVKILNNSDIEINEKDLENIEIEKNENILIYHTHASESYKSYQEYETYKFYRTLDENYNVIKIGNYQIGRAHV